MSEQITPLTSEAMKVAKVNAEQQIVFGWASMATDANGSLIVDSDGEVIEPADLEKAAYDYVLEARDAGQLHEGSPIGKIVESVVITPEKAQEMGLPVTKQTGWWIGIKVFDSDVFAKVKNGTYGMFSIQGTADREEVLSEAV